ncbi:MAG: protein-glutamate O-methyltransferase family protein [Anaerolineae bacterium]|nr:protein-glutamate O-methyltransferase family protein [Anaerolineae bacterium]
MTSEPGSFARATIEERKPAIVAEVLALSPKREVIRHALQALVEEIRHLPISPPPPGVPLHAEWVAHYGLWEGSTWLELPWYFAEAYFYLRLLSAIGYFAGLHPDPFARQKASLLAQSGPVVASMARIERAVGDLPPAEAFTLLARRSLWGNRTDLSNVAVTERHRGDPTHSDQPPPVVDDCRSAYEDLLRAPEAEVVFLCDNAGPELVCDLHLAAWLLDHAAERVALEVKPQPFFVSDAMAREVDATIAYLQGCDDPAVQGVGDRLKDARSRGTLSVRDHPFWCGPDHYDSLPQDLWDRLSRAALVISKGDVNYRRFLRDRHWPFDTPIERALPPFPAPVLLLRTFKGELAAGLSREAVEQLSRADPDWLVSGRQGVAQYRAQARAGRDGATASRPTGGT